MRSRQHADLDRDRAYVFETPAVHADPVLDHALAHAVLDRLVEELADDVRVVGESFPELEDGSPPKLVQS